MPQGESPVSVVWRSLPLSLELGNLIGRLQEILDNPVFLDRPSLGAAPCPHPNCRHTELVPRLMAGIDRANEVRSQIDDLEGGVLNHINGEALPAASGETFENFSPVDDEFICAKNVSLIKY